MALEIEELKKRWLKSAPPLPPWDKPYGGRKERRPEDVEKLAKLAKETFESWFEVKGNKLVFKKMFLDCAP